MNVAEHAERIATILDERGPEDAFDEAVKVPPSIAVEVMETLVATRPGAVGIDIKANPTDPARWQPAVAGLLFRLSHEGLAAHAIGLRANALCGELLALRQAVRRSDRAAYDAVMCGRSIDPSVYLPEGDDRESADRRILLIASRLSIVAACLDPNATLVGAVAEVLAIANSAGIKFVVDGPGEKGGE